MLHFDAQHHKKWDKRQTHNRCWFKSYTIYLKAVFAAPIGPVIRADFRCLYPANAKMPMCCPSDNRTKVTNSVTSARSFWWHVGPYFWPTDLMQTANPIIFSSRLIKLLQYSLARAKCNWHLASAVATYYQHVNPAGI